MEQKNIQKEEKAHGAAQRGGTANCYVVISDKSIGSPIGDEMDDLIVLNRASLEKFQVKLKKGGRLFINSSIVDEVMVRQGMDVVKAPVTELALELGNPKVLNIIMLGVYIGYSQVLPVDIVWSTIEHKLGSKPKLLPLNKAAFEKGLEIGRAQRS